MTRNYVFSMKFLIERMYILNFILHHFIQFHFVLILIGFHTNLMLVFLYIIPAEMTYWIVAKDETVTNNVHVCFVP